MRLKSHPTPEEAVAALCPACGLCCNGTLFVDVELHRDDRAQTLKSFGLKVRSKGRAGNQCFHQPCPAFQDSLCSIYSERPCQCRAFKCGQLKRLAAREIASASALKTIRRARSLADRVLDLLQQCGNQETDKPLTTRYRRTMALPIDLTQGDHVADLRGELMLAMRDLMQLLRRDFLE